jgi:hypothetical protein
MGFRRLSWLGMAALCGAALMAIAPQANAMTLTALEGPTAACAETCILAEGQIVEADVLALKLLARSLKLAPGAVVVFDSTGGDHVSGISLGQIIRKSGFSTRVGHYDAASDRVSAGACASACVYAFIGGVVRSAERGSRIGVHQTLVREKDPYAAGINSQLLMAMAADQLADMGVDPYVLRTALATRPTEVRWFSAAEMSRLGLVTVPLAGGVLDDADQAPMASAPDRLRSRMITRQTFGMRRRMFGGISSAAAPGTAK